MKKYFLITTLLIFNGFVYSQKNVIDKSFIIPKDIDFIDCVKKITLKKYNINKSETKIDTVKSIAEIDFTKNGDINILRTNDNLSLNFLLIVEFDNFNRVKRISRKNDDNLSISVEQYFNGKKEFPDSTITYRENNNIEKHINHFKENLVIKQERFFNKVLQDYRLYKYNNDGQLIEDLYSNPEIDTDETVVFKDNYEISVYPERVTLYEHKIKNDTIITIKIRPKYSMTEVIKKYINTEFKVEIIEKFEKDYLKSARTIYNSKDSISDISIYYNENKEIERYYKTFKSLKNEISVWKNGFSSHDEERTYMTKIDIIFDKFKNWTKKIYSKDGSVIRILEREIEYYCH